MFTKQEHVQDLNVKWMMVKITKNCVKLVFGVCTVDQYLTN